MIVPEADLETATEAEVLMERAILEMGPVRRGPTMILRCYWSTGTIAGV